MLQVLDTAWKDHLHSMDQIKDAIGFRAFSQKDPRIEFKRESARLFDEMKEQIRDRLTDLVFKGRLQPQAARPAQGDGSTPARPAAAGRTAPVQKLEAARSAVAAAAAMLAEAGEDAEAGTEEQRRDLEIAERAGSEEATASGASARTPAPSRTAPAIGRNEVVTVIDPASGERQEMKWKKAEPLVKKGWKLG
jgi:preprotein translocase subunit SecA